MQNGHIWTAYHSQLRRKSAFATSWNGSSPTFLTNSVSIKKTDHPDSPYFLIQYLILDAWGDRRIHTIDFYVRDDKAEFGILLIVYIDHH
jgi:hypothetical protein